MPRFLLSFAQLLTLLAVLTGTLTGTAQAQTGTSGAEINAIVRGIISYTRWPTVRDRLRLCLIGNSAYAPRLRDPVSWFADEGRLDITETAIDDRLPSRCDIIYVGQLVEEQTLQALIALITGEPVLSIGENEGFCSSGGMFCLERSAQEQGVRFSVNLDAISRSGLQINPMVLRLTRQLLQEQ